MKERPILFSTPMVQAILDGRKTMTRRTKSLKYSESLKWNFIRHLHKASGFGATFQYYDGLSKRFIKCPYGSVGDVLWVRETWNTLTTYLEKPDYSVMSIRDFVYKADNDRIDKWKPSIFMPREACRIMLEIINIRVERLQDISEQDAISEGAKCWICGGKIDGTSENDCGCFHSKNEAIHSFEHLWKKINGPESWDANPWVWVIEFKRIDK